MAYAYQGESFTISMVIATSFLLKMDAPVKTNALCKHHNLDFNVARGALTRLESMGWVVKEIVELGPNERSRSKYLWALTEKGRQSGENMLRVFLKDLDWQGMFDPKPMPIETEEGRLPPWFKL